MKIIMKIIGCIFYLSRIIGYLPLVLVVAMMLLIGGNVFTRELLNSPITGASELSQMILIFMLLFLAWCVVEDEHFKIDILAKNLPSRVKGIFDIVNLFLALVTFGFLSWRGYAAALYAKSVNLQFTTLGIPHFYFLLLLVLAFATFCLAVAGRLAQRIIEVIKE
jgi:TRAP-type C4-dicarboxylate transport system permease small subunit